VRLFTAAACLPDSSCSPALLMSFVFRCAEPAFYYDFADAALVMIDACNLPEGQEFITVKDFSTTLVGKGYSVDR
jgi:hypothetical protein